MWEATLSSIGHTRGERPASNFTGPPIHGMSCGMVIVFSSSILGFYTCCPWLSGMSRSVLGANSSSSVTRRSVSPCSWVYWSSASIDGRLDRKSTRLNSSHVKISYAVFCLKKKKKKKSTISLEKKKKKQKQTKK